VRLLDAQAAVATIPDKANREEVGGQWVGGAGRGVGSLRQGRCPQPLLPTHAHGPCCCCCTLQARQRLAPVAGALDGAAKAVAGLRDASGFRWVDLGAMFGALAWR
jgi:hypothetical protein